MLGTENSSVEENHVICWQSRSLPVRHAEVTLAACLGLPSLPSSVSSSPDPPRLTARLQTNKSQHVPLCNTETHHRDAPPLHLLPHKATLAQHPSRSLVCRGLLSRHSTARLHMPVRLIDPRTLKTMSLSAYLTEYPFMLHWKGERYHPWWGD